MQRTMLKSEIRTATVTHALLHREDSITIDADLFDAADLRPGERVTVVCRSNGARLETHATRGAAGAGTISVNGAAVHFIRAGDQISIASYASMTDEQTLSFAPSIVIVDASNRHVDPRSAPPDAQAQCASRRAS